MRRLLLSVITASGLVMVGAGSASAEPVPTGGDAKAAPGKKVCTIDDSRLTEVSGMVATKSGYIVINDSSLNDSAKKIFFLNGDCTVVNPVSYSAPGPRDPEDMVLSKDGKTLWIADIGDNSRERPSIGLWKMPADGSKRPVLYRLTYPAGDGPYDAEALLLNGDGTPIVVTKALTAARVFVPTGTLKSGTGAGVPMRRVGEITVPPSTTPTGLPFGRGAITGGAVAPGGGRVVLRTYSDALEWDVKGGDVLAAIKGTPRVTPLPDERLGESITYSTDGRSFLTTTDMQGSRDPNDVLRYTPVTRTATLTGKLPAVAGGAQSPAAAKGPSWFAALSLKDITYLVGGVGVLGALLVGAGIFGIVRSRRRPPPVPVAALGAGPDRDPVPADAETELIEAPDAGRGRPVGAGSRSGVYGSKGRPSAPAQSSGTQSPGTQSPGTQPPGTQPPKTKPAGPGVYGAPAAAAPQKGSGVYGGAVSTGRPAKGSVYGAQPAAGAGQNGAGQIGAGQIGAGQNGAGQNGAGKGPTTGGPAAPGRGVRGAGAAGSGGKRPAQGPAGQGQAGQGQAGQGPAGQGPAGQGPAGQGPAGQGPAIKGPAGQGPAIKGPAVPSPAAMGHAGRGAAPQGSPAQAASAPGVNGHGPRARGPAASPPVVPGPGTRGTGARGPAVAAGQGPAGRGPSGRGTPGHIPPRSGGGQYPDAQPPPAPGRAQPQSSGRAQPPQAPGRAQPQQPGRAQPPAGRVPAAGQGTSSGRQADSGPVPGNRPRGGPLPAPPPIASSGRPPRPQGAVPLPPSRPQAPPAQPQVPPPVSPGRPAMAPSGRPSGFFGQDTGRQARGRQEANGVYPAPGGRQAPGRQASGRQDPGRQGQDRRESGRTEGGPREGRPGGTTYPDRGGHGEPDHGVRGRRDDR